MGLFGKKNRVIDLTDSSRNLPSSSFSSRPTSTPKFPSQRTATSQSSNNDLIFPADFNPSSQMPSNSSMNSNSEYMDLGNNNGENMEDRRRKLTKRLLDMTDKIEDLSNQIYHLQQRLEVLEKRLGSHRYD